MKPAFTDRPLLILEIRPEANAATPTAKSEVHADTSLAVAVTNNVGLFLSSAAWPLAAVIIASLFQRELAGLMSRVRTFKGLGIEASLDALIQNTLEPISDPSATIDEALIDNVVVPTENLSPLDVIVSSWLKVEAALNAAIGMTGNSGSRPSMKSKLETLSRLPNIPTGLRSRVYELHNIRNRVVHMPSDTISKDSLHLYRENAARVTKELTALANI